MRLITGLLIFNYQFKTIIHNEMKRIILFLAIVMAFCGSAIAQNISNHAGDYYGLLHDITMNSKSGYESRNMTFTISSDGTLSGTLPAVGSMPGNITVSMPVALNGDSIYTTASTKKRVATLKMTVFPYSSIPLYLDGSSSSAFSGTIVNNVLDFTLKVKGSFLGIDYFPASVSFTSTSYTPAN